MSSSDDYKLCVVQIAYKKSELTKDLIELKAENARLSVMEHLTAVMKGEIKA